MKIDLEDVNCPLGCVKNDKHILTGKDILHGLSGEFNIVECATCKLIRTNPRPNSETIGYYYPEDYGPYLGTRVSGQQVNESKLKNFIKPIIHKIFNNKSTSIPKLPEGKMLEIGCASGAYMHQMANKGWQVSGIEFSPKAAETTRALGYDVFTGQLEDAPQPDELYDLIVGWMVLEHLHKPKVCLDKLNEWAKPNSYLVLSIPNINSFEFKLFKNKWHSLHLPNHLYHFTTKTIKLILQNSGWEVTKIYHQKTLGDLFSSIGHTLQEKGFKRIANKFIHMPKYSNYLLFPLAWFLSLFGQTGRMTIWARKSKVSVSK